MERARLDAARRAFELADVRYRSGLIDALTLLSAQAGEIDARERLLQTRLATFDAWIALYAPLDRADAFEIL